MKKDMTTGIDSGEITEGYRGFAGVKYHDNGSYDFWGNFFDTNPYSINNWD